MDPDNVRPIQEGAVNALLEAERVAEATKQAIKRKIAQAASVDFQSRSLPAKLRIEPDDPEDVVICPSLSFYNKLTIQKCRCGKGSSNQPLHLVSPEIYTELTKNHLNLEHSAVNHLTL